MHLELPKWYDLHAHFRQDDLIKPLVQNHVAMGCVGILAMPNTKPPVAKIFKNDALPYWSVEEYKEKLTDAADGALSEVIVPLYLTKDTTPDMIEEGAKSGQLKACKYYPPYGTTGASFGHVLENFMDNGVLKAMQECGITLCLHGEEHGMKSEDYFDRKGNAEEFFYQNRMPKLVDKFPNLRLVGEHLTTKVAVDFIMAAPDHVGATITPQHLLYTVGHMLKSLNYHLYCLPLLKFEEDRHALRIAATSSQNAKFFAGTDSAPHTNKMTPCGCAAGCYTGGVAPQLYAQAFEESSIDLSTTEGFEAFKNFLCINGPKFYNLPIPEETFTLEKSKQVIEPLQVGDNTIFPLPNGLGKEGQSQAIIPWRLIL